MAQHKLRSRIAQFKQPFLVGAVTSAALFSGCGELECPDATPTSGSACDEYEPGLDCAYNGDSGCQREFTCNDGAWDDVSPTCNPPPPDPLEECPGTTPAAGEACDVYGPGLDCEYNDESGCQLEFTCTSDAWEDVSPTCNPPPPELECPEQPPSLGDSCEGYEPGLECESDSEDPSCPEASLLFCGSSGEWDGPVVTCNAPAVVELDAGDDSG